MSVREVLPSPNIWNWPEIYERENRAIDADGALWAALAQRVDWTGCDVVDVGCGDGFHLARFAERARSVVGVEPYPPLVARARRRLPGLSGLNNTTVRVFRGTAGRLPLPDSSADLVHARVAYFFGRGCEPGLAQARRVLRPGGALAVIDLDGTHPPYGEWLCAAAPRYRPAEVEEFFAAQGFDCRRVDTVWRFTDRRDLEDSLRIEFTPEVAARAIAQTPGLAIPVRYRLHVRTEPTVLTVGHWSPP
ncbi:MAG: class I SAM-dependent methyltransferase [Actinobacteria bacterium]|nr:class I SAM-dependent methyltransferase [Actinomycetota bacterium]